MGRDWIDDASRRLAQLRREPGAWGYRPTTALAVEPSALAGLALLASGGGSGREEARKTGLWLASLQRDDGSLGVTDRLPGPGWPTPFASLFWAAAGGFEGGRDAALRFLLADEGRTSARGAHEPMGHDLGLIGWPWTAGTHSWVEPTAAALLVLGREGRAAGRRAGQGVRLLRDRALPTGGWNMGNPVVFGTTLRPLPAPTGLALLALARVDGPSPVIDRALAALRDQLAGTRAPASLGWGVLGLRAWGASPAEAASWLAESYRLSLEREAVAADLALLLLAAGGRSLEVLGITPRGGGTDHV